MSKEKFDKVLDKMLDMCEKQLGEIEGQDVNSINIEIERFSVILKRIAESKSIMGFTE